MKEMHTLRDRFLESKSCGKLCSFFGIDPRQYRLLLDLFSVLGDRMEFMGTTIGLNRAAGMYFAFSLFLSLAAFARPNLPGYLLLMIGYTMFFMLWILLMDAANSIMNPDEASVLAHQPIRGATYVAAKLTHLLVIVAVVVPALNLLPAIAGLYMRESRWFYPFTHLMAAYLSGLFIAFLVCGIYGWFFRYIPPAKLKNAALWLQLAAFPILAISNSLLINYDAFSRIMGGMLRSSWLPWLWFVAVGLAGHAQYPGFSAWGAGAACLLTSAFVVFGLRGFRADYLMKVSGLIQGSASPVVRPSRVSWLNPWVRKLTGAASGYGAFSFASIMMRRDWNFRRLALPMAALWFISPLALLIGSMKNSPFVSGDFAIRSFSFMHFLPHVLGISLAFICPLLSYTAEPQGASIFVALPMRQLRPFVRGIYLSLWMPVGIMHLLLVGPCIWFWGVAHGILFIGFSAALVSLYLGMTILLIDGFPFANAFKPSMGRDQPLILLFYMIPAFIFAVIQWIIFHSAWMVLSAAIALALLAFVTAHFSLQVLEKKVGANYNLLGIGPQQMFKEVE